MALSAVVISAMLILTISNIITTTLAQLQHSQSVCSDHDNNNDFICELRETKLKLSRLESILEESIQSLDNKVHYLEKKEELIVEMTQKTDFLQTSLRDIKDESTYAEERISALEEEVRLLWDASRKNNFDIHILESIARDTEVRLKAVISEVEKLGNIVMEQWIQIGQFDQALLVTEMRTLKVLRRVGRTRCTFLKFIEALSRHHLPRVIGAVEPYLFGQESVKSSYVSQALHQLKKTMLAAKRYHHKLQAFVKQEMEKTEFTAALANPEVIFVLASALITFPILSAWMVLLSHYS